jgi:hypothetical protein
VSTGDRDKGFKTLKIGFWVLNKTLGCSLS